MFMSESFKRIKRKRLLLGVLKSFLLGLASGLGGVGIAFLVVTLGKFDFLWVFHLIIGLGLFFVVGVPIFIKEFPTDLKVAKKLDQDFSLKERVQTLVEYQNSDSVMSKLQREDTNERLRAIEKKSIKFKDILSALVVSIICLSIFASGLAVSLTMKADAQTPSQYVEEIFDYSQNRQNAMLELIKNVRDSKLDEETKENVAGRLEEFHAYVLEGERTVLEVKIAIGIAVAYVDMELEGVTSYREVHKEVARVNSGLADGIVATLTTYKQYSFQFSNFASLTSIYETIVSENELLTSAEKYFSKTEFTLAQIGVEDATHEQIKRNLETFCREANLYLTSTESENPEKPHALKDSFIALTRDLDAYKDKIDEFTDLVGVRAEIHEIFTAFHQSFSLAIDEEIYPSMLQQFIHNKLTEIFKLQSIDLPKITPDPVWSNDREQQEGENPENGGSGGGGGTGETLFPSDDVIYDPDQAKYVKYGEILAEHEAKMQEMLMSSDLPEELKKAILAYFQFIGTYNQKE